MKIYRLRGKFRLSEGGGINIGRIFHYFLSYFNALSSLLHAFVSDLYSYVIYIYICLSGDGEGGVTGDSELNYRGLRSKNKGGLAEGFEVLSLLDPGYL